MKWHFDVLKTFFYVGVYLAEVLYMLLMHIHGSLPAVADFSIGTSLLVFLAITFSLLLENLCTAVRRGGRREAEREEVVPTLTVTQ